MLNFNIMHKCHYYSLSLFGSSLCFDGTSFSLVQVLEKDISDFLHASIMHRALRCDGCAIFSHLSLRSYICLCLSGHTAKFLYIQLICRWDMSDNSFLLIVFSKRTSINCILTFDFLLDLAICTKKC